ncbi:hypothetical protein [Pseudomonas sp. VEM90]
MIRITLSALLCIVSLTVNAENLPSGHNESFRVHGLGSEKCPTILSLSDSGQNRLDDYARGFTTGVNVYSKVARDNTYDPKKKVVVDREGDIAMIDEGVRNAFIETGVLRTNLGVVGMLPRRFAVNL